MDYASKEFDLKIRPKSVDNDRSPFILGGFFTPFVPTTPRVYASESYFDLYTLAHAHILNETGVRVLDASSLDSSAVSYDDGVSMIDIAVMTKLGANLAQQTETAGSKTLELICRICGKTTTMPKDDTFCTQVGVRINSVPSFDVLIPWWDARDFNGGPEAECVSSPISEEQARAATLLGATISNDMTAWVYDTVNPLTDQLTPVKFTESGMPHGNYELYTFSMLWLDIQTWGSFWLLVMIYPITRVISSVMIDKELKVKETFKIMGVTDGVLWASWLFTFAVFYSILALLIACACIYIYQSARIFLIFLFLFELCMTCVAFAFLISSLVNTSKAAGNLSLLLYFAFYLPFFFFETSASKFVPRAGKVASMLCFTSALCYGHLIPLGLELYERKGLDFDTIWTTYNGVAMGDVYVMLVIDFCLYYTLAWYIDKLRPGETGVPQKWYFPFTPRFWRSSCREWCCCGNSSQQAPLKDFESGHDSDDTALFEPDTSLARVVTQVDHISKTFERRSAWTCKKEEVKAVSDVSFNVKHGEILSLLGHNGAGKTTTISMMVGMVPCTSGDIAINGYDVATNTAEARDSIGYCPQHDILFPFMTVKEHLELICQIKGVPPSEVKEEVKVMVNMLQLNEKMNSKSKVLSGGQKRRLSVGMALVGKSAAVFLDEPSTGMDPYTRRALWEALREMKQSRSILLTTHLMEEADYLGDRIAIMAAGSLQCLGSSLFLKGRFGLGYTLTVGLRDDSTSDQESRLTKFVSESLKGSEKTSSIALEVRFKAPFDVATELPTLLETIEDDEDAAKFGVQTLSVGVTSLEEVFLKVGLHADIDLKDNQKHQEGVDPATDLFEEHYKMRVEMSSFATFWFRVRALLIKQSYEQFRDAYSILCQLIFPVLFLIINIAIISSFSSGDPTPITADFYQTWQISPQEVLYNDAAPANAVGLINSCGSNAVIPSPITAATSTAMDDHLFDTRYDTVNGVPRYNAYYFDTPINADDLDVTVFYNSSGRHSLFLGVQQLAECWMNAEGGDLSIESAPLSRPTQNDFVSIQVIIAISFVPALWGLTMTRERITGLKYQMHLAGMTALEYWLSNYIFVYCFYLFPAMCIVFVCLGFDITSLVASDAIAQFIILLLLFGLAVAPFAFVVSLIFANPLNCQGVLVMFGIMLPIAQSSLKYIPGVTKTYDIVKYLVMLVPHCAFGDALFGLTFSQFVEPDVWGFDAVGIGMVYLVIDAILYFGALMLLEDQSTKKVTSKGCWANNKCGKDPIGDELDIALLGDDIVSERDRIQQNVEQDPNYPTKQGLVSMGLRRVFPGASKGCCKKEKNKVAVNDLWLDVPVGQCFGLLGANGAGKTTTTRMMIALEHASRGEAVVGGTSLKGDYVEFRRGVGYCPQFDALADYLTGMNHLYLFSRLNLVPDSAVPRLADKLGDILAISRYLSRETRSYSGGNKRKLSISIAMMGRPAVMFLDEPSAGVDPASRRQVWRLISAISKTGTQSIVLTSHSMEEVEALCQRIGIMRDGNFVALGSGSQLKSKHGKGFQIDINFDSRAFAKQQLERAEHSDGGEAAEVLIPSKSQSFVALEQELEIYVEKLFIRDVFPTAEVAEATWPRMVYEVPRGDDISMAEIFRRLETYKEQFFIRDYAVSQTSLDQIFVNLCREENEFLEAVKVD
eukprot:GHVN01020655.1.p1 GENE.GHVN01020655.1~~GHVN01020655.1.p1  ORF type:complete len:1854 (-),score=254.09 GHVN01020655.1:1150-6147(-)